MPLFPVRAILAPLVGALLVATLSSVPGAQAQQFDVRGIIGNAIQQGLQGERDQPYAGRPSRPGPQRFDDVRRGPPAPLPGDRRAEAYQSDGVTLSAPLSEMPVSRGLECADSQKHPGMKLCVAKDARSVLSVITDGAGRVAYYSRYLGPVRLTPSGVQGSIAHLSSLFGPAKVVDESRGGDGSYSIVTSWGTLSLDQVPSSAQAADDHDMYLQYPRASPGPTNGAPLIHISAGTGFYYLASFDAKGMGVLRYGAYSGRTFNGSAGEPTSPQGEERGRGLQAPKPFPGPADRISRGDQRYAPWANANPSLMPPGEDVDPIAGEWTGEATCDGKHRDLSLTVGPNKTPNFEATVAFFDDDALANPVPRLKLLARQEGDAGTYRFVPSQVSDKLAFTAVLPPNGAGLRINSNVCGSFSLQRADASVGVPSPHALSSNGYRMTDPLASRCKAIATWINRMVVEYPDIDLHHTAMEKLFPKAVLLFSDQDFLPSFGFRYDAAAIRVTRQQDATASRITLAQVGHDLSVECGQDPFIRQDGADFWGNPLFQSAFPSTVISSFTIEDVGSFSISAIKHYIRTSRAVHSAIAARLADQRPDAAGSIAGLVAVKSYVDDHAMYLWPSERAKLDADVTAKVQSLAQVEKTQEVARLQAERDPVRGLAEAQAFRGDSSGAFTNLSPEARQKLSAEVDEASHRFAVQVFAPFQKEIDEAGHDLSSATRLQGVEERAKEKLDLFSEGDRRAFIDAVKQKVSGILADLVAGDVRLLNSFPASRDGLKAGCGWIADFAAKYSQFSTEPSVRDGTHQFDVIRANRLLAALPDARQALAKAGADQGEQQAVLRDYLCWTDDRRLPESLEYDLLAAERGLASPQ